MGDNFSVKDALTQAAVKLRSTVTAGSDVLSPNASQPIQIDPVLGSFFGITHPDGETADKVSKVTDWLIKQHCNTHEERLNALRSIETRLGDAQGGTRLDKLYNYVTLRTKASDLLHQADALLK